MDGSNMEEEKNYQQYRTAVWILWWPDKTGTRPVQAAKLAR